MKKMNKAESLAKASKDLMLKEPFYGLFLIGLNKKWSEHVPTAGVGLNKINTELHINSDWWETLTPPQHMGLLKHELLHIAFFHLTDYNHLEDQMVANIAMDIEINQYIDINYLPTEPAPQLPSTYPDLNLDLKAGTMYYYEKLMEQKEKNNEDLKTVLQAMMNGEGQCQLPSTGETVQLPQHDWEEMANLDESTEKLVKAQIGHHLNQVADQVTKSRGTVPGEMELLIEKLNITEPPKFDWRGYIRRFHGKSIKTYTKKSRRKFSKRMPDFPGLKIKQQKHILCGIDTSASVNEDELKEFFHEIHHMHKTGSEVTVVQCDTAIAKVEKFNPRNDYEIEGRGGTDFQPVIDFYNEHQHKYSCLMYLTDGEAPAPENAKGNILWVLSSISDMNDDLPGAIIQLN
jgi:predicted metal-dependent peptidase